ncbi:DUF4062 domain-containing protein [Leptothoe spongobia]|uniref:DUF4062 domain-containing protein n=1 Tax=Leptothoe spongobia TAU-MAC 1115 TaxID=1967444 RepID=A0A947GS62_9CYAN|nr:DUF4062 domain-containing protein [Leptothoe spongobia]MBT9317831.1 DUF4062 domain-containing protein [Leptothoe spongobia TAU-MAC 1115]
MTHSNAHVPVYFPGVMVSSTFNDLQEHRAALIKAIDGQELKAVVMENDAAKPDIDVIDSSLQMVQKASGYIGVISHRYGSIHKDTKRNPHGLSLTELEFHEAQRLNRPILLFIMGEDHHVKASDVERDPEKITKLEAFRESAKLPANSSVPRIYKVFNNLDEFTAAVIQSVAELRRLLQEEPKFELEATENPSHPDGIPQPPAFYAEPPYIGTHEFIGRKTQLKTLNDWVTRADPNPILLFEAIGGTGKSMLTWHWTKKYATSMRNDWAGIFWYSFYERGAIMADFCRRALAYMTGQPLKELNNKKTLELSELLFRQLNARPWLLILDGLERVLVAYNSFDAAQLADEEAGKTDEVDHRNPRDAIRPEDGDLLRMLAVTDPSKLLLTTRLTPRALLNQAGQPIPGVLHKRLPGLNPPADAEALLRACGISGNSQTMQSYLKRHCDCHPLVTGIVAGLVNDYFPARGDFDAWAKDPNHGGHFNLAKLDLVQKRNHILNKALDTLSPESRQLLSSLSLLSESADTELLNALNPHLPTEPESVYRPDDPREEYYWDEISEEERQVDLFRYQERLKVWQSYQDEYKAWQQKVKLAQQELLPKTVRDLEQRGLLQYDRTTNRYDLHPVVRGMAAGGLKLEDRERLGRPLIDHFSQSSHSIRYQKVETLEDIWSEISLVRTFLQMERYQQAADTYDDIATVFMFNLENDNEALSLLRPLFSSPWNEVIDSVPSFQTRHILNSAGFHLNKIGKTSESIDSFGAAISLSLQMERPYKLHSTDIASLGVYLYNLSTTFKAENRLAKASRALSLSSQFKFLHGEINDSKGYIFDALLREFSNTSLIGRWRDAEDLWNRLDSMGRLYIRGLGEPGDAEAALAWELFWQGKLQENEIKLAETLATESKCRATMRSLHSLRGQWSIEKENWTEAIASLQNVVSMFRETGKRDIESEAFLALAQYYSGQLPEPQYLAERLSSADNKRQAHRPIAQLWLASGDPEQAAKHALKAYQWAWADGEPYVHRYELDKARELLEQLNVEIPDLPSYDPAKEKTYSWEENVAAAIEELKAEAEAEKAAKKQ